MNVDGIELHYVERGAGEQSVVFAHSYLVDHRQFEAQMEALAPHYRVIAYDHRDHGQSGRARAGYVLRDLVEDAVAIVEQTSAAPCHFVGLSTGGFVGLHLGLNHPDLLRSLTLMDTSAEAEPTAKRLKYRAMLLALREIGMGPVIGSAMRTMFGRTPLADPARASMIATWRDRIGSQDPAALSRFGKAIFARESVLDRIDAIETPTLVVVGEEDRAQPVVRSRRIAEAIPQARLEIIAGAGHLCTVERPDAVNDVLVPFIREVS